jgi:hypothetical protein
MVTTTDETVCEPMLIFQEACNRCIENCEKGVRVWETVTTVRV